MTTNEKGQKQGEWGDVFELDNVSVHATLLPTGKVLYWGRRANPRNTDDASLNEHATNTYLWDPSTRKSKPIGSKPKRETGEEVNLFCGGHCLQPDGTVLVIGGHWKDSQGIDQASVYDPFSDTWSPKAHMNHGRWYPTALTLPDGSALAISGSYLGDDGKTIVNNMIPQLLRNDAWEQVSEPPLLNLLFPRLHLDPKGRVFMSGPQAQSQYLDVNTVNAANPSGGIGTWTTDGPQRAAKDREYAPSVMYRSGKIIYIGGGNDFGNPGSQKPPTKIAELIDLNSANPQWRMTSEMHFARRQHNGTVLPDGTVFVNGGTQGGTPPYEFNDLSAGMPVHTSELWDPLTEKWTIMDEEKVDRCYHSISLLLPDGRVLSAGGGEYSPDNDGRANPTKDTITNAQIFKPPYLFKGPQPTVSNAPSEINYGKQFSVIVGATDSIEMVSWVRLGSVTHACNMNQSLMFLDFKQDGSKIILNAPDSANHAPPGHYMLFLLNQLGVPSVAPIIRIGSTSAPKPASIPKPSSSTPVFAKSVATANYAVTGLPARNKKIIAEEDRPAVVVGLTPVCPYGLGACWGGAFNALQGISDVDVVRPVPNQADSVAFVYLQQDIIPDIDVWRNEFADSANGSYEMRGIEMKLSGVVTKGQSSTDTQLMLAGTSSRPDIALAPFQATSKIEWDRAARAPKPMTDAEADSYAQLLAALADHPKGLNVQVTGRLQKDDANKFSLDVRHFEVENEAATA